MNAKGGWMLGLVLLGSSNVLAQPWKYHGFVNQTLINTSDNFMFGRTDDNVSLDYRELGLILNGRLLPALEFSSQLLSRKAGVSDDGTPRVDYAFFTWQLHESLNTTHGLRLGRLKAPIGFYNDSRDSPFTRIGVFLPQSIYVDRTRNFIMQADELMYFGEWRSDEWIVSWKMAGGYNNPDKKELADFFHIPDDLNASFDPTRVWQFQTMADYDAGRIRFGYSEYDSPSKYRIGPVPLIGVVRSQGNSHWRMLSFEYNDSNWTFTGEIIRGIVRYIGISPDPANPDYRDYPEAAYAQFLWRVNETHSAFIRREYNYLNHHDKEGMHYASFPMAQAAGLVPEDRFGKSMVLGWIYVPSYSWQISLEVSKNIGTMLMTERDAPAGYVAERHWNMAALAVAWRF